MTDLLGTWCYVMAKSGRHRWCVRIVDVQPGGFVKVSANQDGGNLPKRAFGNARWVKFQDLWKHDGRPLCAENERT